MRLILISALFLLALGVSSVVGDKREEAIECVLRYVDVNPKDGCVDSLEVSDARINCVPWWKRSLVPRVETIMRDCDFDGNGCISGDDMRRANATCLHKESDLDLLLDDFCPNARDNHCNE